jgi:large subunit ribosomal protein L25
MTTESLTIKGTRRERLGTKHARRLRASGQLPAIIYGHGQDPVAIALSAHEVGVELQHGSRVLKVDLDDQGQQFLVKSVQYDYLGTTPVHIDLMRVDMHERVTVTVGIELRGTPKGAADGGVLEQVMSNIEVECMVTNIPDTLHPRVTDLGLGESLLVKDLKLPEGVTALADPNDRVATVRMLAEEAAAEEAAEGEAVQPEVIGRPKKDEDEE